MKAIDYQKLTSELDSVVIRLQSEDLAIDEALKLYERGIAITKDLETYLKEAENKVTKVSGQAEG